MAQENTPQVVNAPSWDSNAKIEMNGREFEAIYNFIANAQEASLAIHSVMQKNLVNGTIRMNFRKLNDTGTDYVEMTPEEQRPYKEEFDQLLKEASNLAQKAVNGSKELSSELSPQQEGTLSAL